MAPRFWGYNVTSTQLPCFETSVWNSPLLSLPLPKREPPKKYVGFGSRLRDWLSRKKLNSLEIRIFLASVLFLASHLAVTSQPKFSPTSPNLASPQPAPPPAAPSALFYYIFHMTVHPPPSDAESQQWFARYDRGQKGHVTLEELHSLLNDRGSSLWAPFDQDTGKIMVSFILTGGLFLVEVAPGVGGDENPSDHTKLKSK